MENTSAWDSASCPAGNAMKVSSPSSLSVSESRGTSVQRALLPSPFRSPPQSSLHPSTILGILRVMASVGRAVCRSVSGELSVGNSGLEGGTRPRSIEGGEGRSSSMIATRLERGRELPSPERVGPGCSQYSRVRMLVTPLGNGAL
eukprot:3646113-Pyramimonas_sp.AAC.1